MRIAHLLRADRTAAGWHVPCEYVPPVRPSAILSERKCRYAIVDEEMLKGGAAKLQILHGAQAPMAPVIQLTDAPRPKRVNSSARRGTGRTSGQISRTCAAWRRTRVTP